MNPDISAVLGGALRDAWPALRSWLGWLIALLVITAAAGVVMFLNAPAQRSTEMSPVFLLAYMVMVIAMLAACLFIMASAVRTVRPDFAMTAGKFFGFLGYAILVGLIIMLGFIALIIPGFYLSVKLQLTPYMYLLGVQEPLKAAWHSTKGRWWLTLGVMLLIGIIAELMIMVAFVPVYIVVFFSQQNPVALSIVSPIIVAAFFFVVQFEYNAYMRYADALIQSAAPLPAQNSVS
jgi:hypothetical protein